MSGRSSRAAVQIGGEEIQPGERRRIEIPVARLPAMQVELALTVEVLHGLRSGPKIWLSAAIHGDELNGIEIIRRVRQRIDPRKLHGTVFSVPIVNAFGFLQESRYLPDRRDLNRSFPGSPRGPLASRVAAIFMQEVVARCSHGIDLHTGSDHRTNLPQIRANMRDPETRRCALAFGAPISIDSQTRDGSLRYAAAKLGKHVLLYEAGEPLRFDDDAIEHGTRGVLRVMSALGMGPSRRSVVRGPVAVKTQWVRARASGLLRLRVKPGDRVTRKQLLGRITDAFGEMDVGLVAPEAGIIIGMTLRPLVRQGDAAVHIATRFENAVREASPS